MQQQVSELALAAAEVIRTTRKPEGYERRRGMKWLTTPKRAPGGGRKPRDPEAGETSNLTIRINQREREQLEEQAEKREVSIADVIRQDLTKTGTFYDPAKPRRR